MDSKVFIRLKDKKNGCESEEVTIEDVIFNQHDIEFEFPNYTDEDGYTFDAQLPYSDFLFDADDYEVIVRIGDERGAE